MTTDAPTQVLELPLRLERGEVRFSINLALIDDVPELYKLVKALGFSDPQIVLMHYAATEVHLLLHRELYSELYDAPHELYEDEQYALANAINTDAIHFRCGLMPKPTPIAA